MTEKIFKKFFILPYLEFKSSVFNLSSEFCSLFSFSSLVADDIKITETVVFWCHQPSQITLLLFFDT